MDSGQSITIPNLNVGTYDVVAIYIGNQNYTYNYAVKSFNVIKKNLTITLDAATPCYVDTPIRLTATLGEIVSGTVIFNIGGENHTKEISNSNEVTFDYTPLDNTTLTVVATFMGNDEFNGNSSNSVVLTVNKIPTDINVTSNSPIVVGEEAQFTINMNVSVNTTVKLRIGDKNYIIAIVNGVGSYNISGLPANDGYDVNVTFGGDFKYINSTNRTTLAVNKISDYPLNVTTENIVVGDNETITVVLPADVDPTKLVIKVDQDIVTPVSVVNGVATVVVPGLAVGNHVVNVTYLGDDKYGAKDNNSNIFTVSPSKINNIVLTVVNQTYGQDTTFTVSLHEGVSENVTITVDGVDYSRKPDASGVATLTLNNLSGGLHAVYAYYPGDNNYLSNSTSATFIIGRADSTIDVNFTTPKSVGDDVLINVSMGQKINGTVMGVGNN